MKYTNLLEPSGYHALKVEGGRGLVDIVMLWSLTLGTVMFNRTVHSRPEIANIVRTLAHVKSKICSDCLKGGRGPA